MKKLVSVFLALIFVFTLILPAAAADSASGATLRLKKAEGTVTITKSSGSAVTVKSDMRLLSGYSVKTGAASYAYISLDDTKAVKLDASSEVSIDKSGKKLEINLVSGALFFDVSKPLEGDEQLNIKTSTMITGVRGTSGVVRVKPLRRVQNTTLALFDGLVLATTFPNGAKLDTHVEAGKELDAVAGTTSEIKVEEIPGFAAVEIASDPKLQERVTETFGEETTQEIVSGAEERLASDEAKAEETAQELETVLDEQKDEQQKIDEEAGLSTPEEEPEEKPDEESEEKSDEESDEKSNKESAKKNDIQVFENTEPAPDTVTTTGTGGGFGGGGYSGGGDPGGGTSEPPSTTFTVMSADEFVAALETAEDNPSTSYTITIAATSPINGSNIEEAIRNANSARESAGKSPMHPDISIKSNTTVISNENFQPDRLMLQGGTLGGTLNYETNLTIDIGGTVESLDGTSERDYSGGAIAEGSTISVNELYINVQEASKSTPASIAGSVTTNSLTVSENAQLSISSGAAVNVSNPLTLSKATLTNSGSLNGTDITLQNGAQFTNSGDITLTVDPNGQKDYTEIAIADSSTFNQTGGTINDHDSSAGPYSLPDIEITVGAQATLNVTGGTIYASSSSTYAIKVSGTCNVSGGTVVNQKMYAPIEVESTGHLTLSGNGTIRDESGNAAIYSMSGGEVEITGGTAQGSNSGNAIQTQYGKLTVSGGTISAPNRVAIQSTGDEITITGGTISTTATDSLNGAAIKARTSRISISGADTIISAEAGSAVYAESCAANETTPGVTITGGKLSSVSGNAVELKSCYQNESGTVPGALITGGEISSEGGYAIYVQRSYLYGNGSDSSIKPEILIKGGKISSTNSSAIVLSSSTLTVGEWNDGNPTGSADIQAAQNGIWIKDENVQTSGGESNVTLYAGKISTSAGVGGEYYALNGSSFHLGAADSNQARAVAEKATVQLGGIYYTEPYSQNLLSFPEAISPYGLEQTESVGAITYYAICVSG